MESQEQLKENPHSVEISINAKGQYSGKIKVYAATIEEAYDKSVSHAQKLNDLIKVKNQ